MGACGGAPSPRGLLKPKPSTALDHSPPTALRWLALLARMRLLLPLRLLRLLILLCPLCIMRLARPFSWESCFGRGAAAAASEA